MEKEIKDFIIRGGHTKSLPKIGNPVSAVEDYIDKTRKLTEEQRTILATFLCNSYKEISYRTPDVASLIHNIITFVLEFNETDIAEERIHLEVDTENIRKTCSSDDGTENLEPIVPSDIKYPPKLSRKGRPKGSEKTVIGITKKSKRHHLQPFFKKSSVIKELAILQWILGDEKGRTVFDDKEKVFQNEVQDLAFSSALIDDNVDLLIVEKFFTKEAMIDVMSVVMRNKENSFHKCSSCTMDLNLKTNVVKCSSCLGWNHLPCVFLKTVPKAEHWYCKRCKQINK